MTNPSSKDNIRSFIDRPADAPASAEAPVTEPSAARPAKKNRRMKKTTTSAATQSHTRPGRVTLMTTQLNVRIPVAVSDRLESAIQVRSIAEGRHVTKAEIVSTAIREFCNDIDDEDYSE